MPGGGDDKFCDGEDCFLKRLAVLPDARGQGFGKALVMRVFEDAQRQGFRFVRIAIVAEHMELLHWYQQIGFVEKETKTYPHLPFRVMYLAYDLRSRTL